MAQGYGSRELTWPLYRIVARLSQEETENKLKDVRIVITYTLFMLKCVGILTPGVNYQAGRTKVVNAPVQIRLFHAIHNQRQSLRDGHQHAPVDGIREHFLDYIVCPESSFRG